jgi:hypothetical protein
MNQHLPCHKFTILLLLFTVYRLLFTQQALAQTATSSAQTFFVPELGHTITSPTPQSTATQTPVPTPIALHLEKITLPTPSPHPSILGAYHLNLPAPVAPDILNTLLKLSLLASLFLVL